jgi:hypothetical protein
MEPRESGCLPPATFFAMIIYHGCWCSIAITQSGILKAYMKTYTCAFFLKHKNAQNVTL